MPNQNTQVRWSAVVTLDRENPKDSNNRMSAAKQSCHIGFVSVTEKHSMSSQCWLCGSIAVHVDVETDWNQALKVFTIAGAAMLANVCNCPSAAVWARRPPPANHCRTEWSGMESVCVCVTVFLISVSQTEVTVATGTINQYYVTGGVAAGKAWKHRYTNIPDIRTRESLTRKPDWPRIHVTRLPLGLLARTHILKMENIHRFLCRTWSWILTLDGLIPHANPLPFLWTLAHKSFTDSFFGTKVIKLWPDERWRII